MTRHNSETSQITEVAPGADLLGTPDRPTVIAGVCCWWVPWPQASCFLVGPSVSPSVPPSLSQYLCDRSSGEWRRRGGEYFSPRFFVLSLLEFCWGVGGKYGEKSSARQNVLFPLPGVLLCASNWLNDGEKNPLAVVQQAQLPAVICH